MQTSTLPVVYEQNEETLTKAVAAVKGLTIKSVEDREGYALVHRKRVELKSLRVAIEKQRVDLKADALEWGRRVDAEAKRLTAIVEPAELALESEQRRIDAEREAIKAAAEKARRDKLDGRVAALVALGLSPSASALADIPDAEFEEMLAAARAEHAVRVERERIEAAEKARVEAQAKAAEEAARKLEQERLAADRAELERQRAAQAAEQKRLDEERAAALAEQARQDAARRAEHEAERRRLDEERRALEAERARLAAAALAPVQADESLHTEAEPIRCATFTDPATIPADVRVRMDADRAAAVAEWDAEDEREAIEAATVAYFERTEASEVRRVRFLEVCADRTTSSQGDERLAFMALGYLAGVQAERARKAEGS